MHVALSGSSQLITRVCQHLSVAANLPFKMSNAQVQSSSETESVGFDALQLQVGTRLQLTVTRDVKQVQLFSSVIGWVKNEYLLLQIPMDGAQPFPLREGDRLTLRVFSGVQVCWFHVTALRLVVHPYLYMHVSFPREIFGRQLRTALRVRVNLPVHLSMPGNAEGISATMRNVSISGASLETTQSIPETVDKLRLRFELQTGADMPAMHIETSAALRNRATNPVNDPANPYVHTYGIQFLDLDATHKLALQNLIYETLMTDRQKLV